jgi:hypothetical protein
MEMVSDRKQTVIFSYPFAPSHRASLDKLRFESGGYIG